MRIRLMFEPNPGVMCNVNEMFRCYAENYLSDYPEFEWGGYIVMNVFDMKYNKNASGEPLYQFLATNCGEETLNNILNYVKTNPMHGYHTHVQMGLPNENEKVISY